MRSMRWIRIGTFAAFGLVLSACGGSQKAKNPPMVADSPASVDTTPEEDAKNWSSEDAGSAAAAGASSTDPVVQGTEEGAQTLLKQFVAPNADHAALTRSLRPTSFDYKALFDATTAVKVEALQAKDWESNKAI